MIYRPTIVSCDGCCGRRVNLGEVASPKVVRSELRRHGWLVAGGAHWCHACSTPDMRATGEGEP